MKPNNDDELTERLHKDFKALPFVLQCLIHATRSYPRWARDRTAELRSSRQVRSPAVQYNSSITGQWRFSRWDGRYVQDYTDKQGVLHYGFMSDRWLDVDPFAAYTNILEKQLRGKDEVLQAFRESYSRYVEAVELLANGHSIYDMSYTDHDPDGTKEHEVSHDPEYNWVECTCGYVLVLTPSPLVIDYLRNKGNFSI